MLVDKYKPKSLEEVVSQKSMISDIISWLEKWKPGKALMLHGTSGLGKNLLVELIAKERNLRILEVNASDKRNAESMKKLIPATKEGSLMGGRLILVDEAENLSGMSDRGGSGEIIEIIKKSAHPVILISQNPYDKKLQSIRRYCDMLKFRKIPKNMIAKFLANVAEKEGFKIDQQILSDISENSNGDMRSALNDLEMRAMGYREIQLSIFETMQAIFKKDIKTALDAINLSEKNADEILWWTEQNITTEFSKTQDIAKAFDLLSKADMFREKIYKNQNWRFKKYMKDMIASMSSLGSKKGFTMYRPPDMFMILGRTKKKRAEDDEFYGELSERLHCSKRKVREQMPFMKLFLK
ncbi:MAG: replication factor C large subunit [Candidatus Aenigmarchaeota archaeon]|nr:replication factor C large subunit [Candidatus Aenigmarchaeota archaeon]